MGKPLWFTRENLEHIITGHNNFAKEVSTTLTEVNNTFNEVYQNLNEIDGRVTNLEPVYTTFTIPTSGWSSDSTGDYPNYYDFTVSGLTTADCVDVNITVAGINTAIACGLCPTTETLEGKFRIRTFDIPSVAIPAQYRVIKGS